MKEEYHLVFRFLIVVLTGTFIISGRDDITMVLTETKEPDNKQ